MQFCVNCGNENSVGVRFCSKCGAEQVATLVDCSNCGKTLEENEKFCSGCGTPAGEKTAPKPKTEPQPEPKPKEENRTKEGRKIISGGPKPTTNKQTSLVTPATCNTHSKEKKGLHGLPREKFAWNFGFINCRSGCYLEFAR